MNAGQDEKLIEVHSRAMDYINQALIELQDETVKRMSDAQEAAEARATELAAQLETARAEITYLKYWLDVAKNRINEMLQEDKP